jgi:hypothetical protein
MYTVNFSGSIDVDASYKDDHYYLDVYFVRFGKKRPTGTAAKVFPGHDVDDAKAYLASLGFDAWEAWKILKDANPAYDAPEPLIGLSKVVGKRLIAGGLQ